MRSVGSGCNAHALSMPPPSKRHDGATLRAARRLNRATGVLATSVLLDSAVEHYRGSFNNPAMVMPLIVSALALGRQRAWHRRQAAGGASGTAGDLCAGAVTGLLGTGFHIYNVLKRPGAAGVAEPVLRRAAGCSDGDPARRAAGLCGRSGARQSGAVAHACLACLPARLLSAISGLGLLGTTARSRAVAFSRRLP